MDEAEMSQVLKEAFRLYGSQIGQAMNVPLALHPLINGEDATVIVHLSKNYTLTMMPYDTTTKEAEIQALEKTVKTQKTEIKSLENEIPTAVEEPEEAEVTTVKPRRKRG